LQINEDTDQLIFTSETDTQLKNKMVAHEQKVSNQASSVIWKRPRANCKQHGKIMIQLWAEEDARVINKCRCATCERNRRSVLENMSRNKLAQMHDIDAKKSCTSQESADNRNRPQKQVHTFFSVQVQ